jgi:hypothetical protein
MIKFFRKTRQNLLSEGKTKTYLKYAIGEIALVVIGILIALQINNWNTENKKSDTEFEILKAMKENLNSDIQDMEVNLDTYSVGLKSTAQVLNSFNIPSYDNDSINIYYGNLKDTAFFIETTSAYENLKNIGFEIIRNDSLKKKIMDIYGKQYQFIENLENRHSDFVYSQLHPSLRNNFITESITTAYPVNISELKKNQQFKELLKSNIGWLYYLMAIYNDTKDEVKTLVEQIDHRLKQLK